MVILKSLFLLGNSEYLAKLYKNKAYVYLKNNCGEYPDNTEDIIKQHICYFRNMLLQMN